MFRPHLSYVGAISVNRRLSGYPWRGGPVRSDFQWRLLYPVNLRCLARSGRWRQRSSEWLGMLVIMVWTRCQVFISQVHNSWILNHSNWHTCSALRGTKRTKSTFAYGVWGCHNHVTFSWMIILNPAESLKPFAFVLVSHTALDTDTRHWTPASPLHSVNQWGQSAHYASVYLLHMLT